MGYQRKTNEIFIVREASRGYSNGCPFGSHTPTRVRRFENHASVIQTIKQLFNFSYEGT
jgi:hypothetical protein